MDTYLGQIACGNDFHSSVKVPSLKTCKWVFSLHEDSLWPLSTLWGSDVNLCVTYHDTLCCFTLHRLQVVFQYRKNQWRCWITAEFSPGASAWGQVSTQKRDTTWNIFIVAVIWNFFCLLEGGIFPNILSIGDYCNKSTLQLYLLSCNFLLCNCILSY